MAFDNINLIARLWKKQGVEYIFSPDAKTLDFAPLNEYKERNLPKNIPAQPKKIINRQNQPVKTEKAVIENVFKPLAYDLWPKNWQIMLNKTKKGKIGWTYWLLGQDLDTREEDTEKIIELRKTHGIFLKKFFQDLNLPSGTHCLWPACLPDEDANNTLKANYAVYWTGLKNLGCRGTVILGSEAAWTMLNRTNLKPLTLHMVNGQHVWILSDIDIMINDQEKYRLSLNFLRHALRGFIAQIS